LYLRVWYLLPVLAHKVNLAHLALRVQLALLAPLVQQHHK